MFYSEQKDRVWRDKKKNSNSFVVRKQISERKKNHNPPLQVKRSVPYNVMLILSEEI